MAFVEPKTWAAGDVLTAADMNSMVRDNVDFLSEPPRVRLGASGTQSIPDTTNTDVTWDTEIFDTDSMHSGSLATITMTTAGTYYVGCTLVWAANTTNSRIIYLVEPDGSGLYATARAVSNMQETPIVSLFNFAAAETTKVMVYQDTGGALHCKFNATTYNYNAFFAHWIGE